MKPPIYHTTRFTLRPLSNIKEEEDRFVEMALDPLSVTFMGGANGIEQEERELFQKVFTIYKRYDERWFWIWGIYKNDRLCGSLELKDTEYTQADELEIVYLVHPEERGKGLMSQVLTFLKKNQTLWQRKITATVSPKNKASLALLEKWGVTKRVMLEDDGKAFYKIWLK